MSRARTAILAGAVLVLTLFAWTGTAQAAVAERVSVASDGTQGDGRSGSQYAFGPSLAVSADGRYVAFESQATNLVTGDTNAVGDIFVRDRDTGTTTRVSVSSSDVQGNGDCSSPSISADGRYVAFNSAASNLVSGDTNARNDVFVRDRDTGVTTRVSLTSGGAQANGHSGYLSLSADGGHVAFASEATNLVSGDTNGWYDVFVRDLGGGVTTRVSVATGGAQANGPSGYPSLSADGGYVAFSSDATNLVAGDTNAKTDIFVRNRTGVSTTRVSVASSGTQAVLECDYPCISADGRYVSFRSYAFNLVTGDWNGIHDAFLHDRLNGTTELVSRSSDGSQYNDGIYNPPTISADGRYVAFNGFVRDRTTGATTRVVTASDGGDPNYGIGRLFVTGDGGRVAFPSTATNLMVGDTNGESDVFVASVEWTPVVSSVSPTTGSVGGTNSVTISGNNFLDVTAVTFGGTPATDFTVVNPSRITATAPAQGPGSVQVQVTTGFGATADTTADNYTYSLPTITGVAPNHGSSEGGNTVVITGTYFSGASAVTFGGTPATGYNVDSATQITATSPAHAVGAVQVQVTTGGYSTSNVTADDYTFYLPPTITVIDPVTGPVPGGTVVTITGTAFQGLTGPGAVTFGGKNALSYTVDSTTQITATAPYHVAGAVRVQVINGGGSTPDTGADDYTYVADPSSPLQAHERVSLDSAEAQGNSDSGFPATSGDGRYVAFASNASNLALGDTNGVVDVFVRDRETGATERVSVATDGTQGGKESGDPAISADGRYVAFCVGCDESGAGDTNGWTDIFVHDRRDRAPPSG